MKTTLKQLKVFVETAKTGSLSGAATTCFLSQPAASMSLQQLESTLKAPLFDRVGKRLILNSQGEYLLPKAIALIEQARDFESALLTAPSTLTGKIVIGCTQTIGNYRLPAYIARFKHHHPHVICEQIMTNTQQSLAHVKAFHCDFALIEGEAVGDSALIYQPWRQDAMTIIARAGHPLSQLTHVSNHDLASFPWVLREKGSGTADIIEKSAHGQLDLTIENRFTSFEAIKNYVSQSDCLSMISTAALSQNDHQLCQLTADTFHVTRPWTLALHKDKYQSAASERFRAFLFGLSTLAMHTK